MGKTLNYVGFLCAICSLIGGIYSLFFPLPCPFFLGEEGEKESVSCCLCSVFLFFLALIFYLLAVVQRYPHLDLKGKHVLITGGSSGIGLSTAILSAKEGASVTIVARNLKKLEEAKAKIESEVSGAKVLCFSLDVGDAKKTREIFAAAVQEMKKPISVLVMSAGVSIPLHFEDYEDEEFERLMRINYLGSVYSSRAALPYMREAGGGRLVFVSSMAGLLGVTGFTTYSPSKFAVRGLAETLHMELQPHNIQVSLVNPADVDTPMYEVEMKSKPLACRLISEGSGLFTPEAIAKDIISAVKNWRFMVNTGFDGTLLGVLTSGFGPVSSVTEALFQIFGMGIIRAYCLAVIWNFNQITIDSWAKERKEK